MRILTEILAKNRVIYFVLRVHFQPFENNPFMNRAWYNGTRLVPVTDVVVRRASSRSRVPALQTIDEKYAVNEDHCTRAYNFTDSADCQIFTQNDQMCARALVLIVYMCVPLSLSDTDTVIEKWWWCRSSCPRMSVDILGTNCDQCLNMVQCCFDHGRNRKAH